MTKSCVAKVKKMLSIKSGKAVVMRLLFCLLILFSCFSCESIFENNNDSVVKPITEPAEDNRVPTITIKRQESEKVDNGRGLRGENITWRVYADPAPLTDVVVRVSIPSSNNQSVDYWVMISKFKPYSKEFTNTIYSGAIEIFSLPMISVVGEGLVVNVEKLRGGLPSNTYGGHWIPKDFDFPVYNVGNPSQILCDDCSIPISPPPPPPSRPAGEQRVGPPPATDVSMHPTAGATILSNQRFTLTFDQGIVAATVNGFPATGSGLNWTVFPALAQGSATLNVEWTNRDGSTGSKAVGPYAVKNPDVIPPRIVSGTVSNRQIKVNPGPINAGGFRFDFNEPVTGTVKLTDESGADLNWIANVGAQTATLTPVAGNELGSGTAYFVEIDVKDAAGNRNRINIVFVTNIK